MSVTPKYWDDKIKLNKVFLVNICVEEWRSRRSRLNFDEIPFYDLYKLAYQHAENLDLHQPFIGEGVKELIDRINPSYVTFEFRQKSKEEYQQFIMDQGKYLGYV